MFMCLHEWNLLTNRTCPFKSRSPGMNGGSPSGPKVISSCGGKGDGGGGGAGKKLLTSVRESWNVVNFSSSF